MNGFRLFRRDRKTCRCRQTSCQEPHGGGGVLIYIKDHYHSEIQEIAKEAESLWIKVSSKSCPQPLFINVTYHPPGINPTPTIQYLSESLRRITSSYPRSSIVIGGDFNRIDLTDLEFDFSLSILDSPPTRGDASLDLILTNRPDLILSTSCFVPSVESDHQALLMLPRCRIPPKRTKIQFVDYSFRGFQKLNDLLESESFAQVYTETDVNKAAALLDNKISECVKEAFPVRAISISDRDPVWITPRAKWLIEKKKRAVKRGKPTLCQHLNNKLEEIKVKHFQKNQSKLMWNNVDDISHRKYSQDTILYDGFDPEDLNIALANRSAAGTTVEFQPLSFDKTNRPPPKLTLSEVARAMQYCKRTSTGPARIPTFVYNEFWDILAPIYLHVWNNSLEQGAFPNNYKNANLIPLPKCSNARQTEDIRGISITSISSRLFERCVHKKWIQPKVERLGDTFQFAYKSKLSTIDCLLTLQQYVLSLLDQPLVDGIHLIMWDFSKAFDRINQELAAETFPKFISSPHICQWLYDFIINRHQRLIWQGKTLPYRPIERGCSQGTVGGPSIFSMFSDDICAKSQPSIAFKYSDDTNVLTPCKAFPTSTERWNLENEVQHFKECAQKKQLIINENKTKIIRFSLRKNSNCLCKYNRIFDEVQNNKILGIQFDSNCRFTTHVTVLIRSLKRSLFIIRDLQLNNFHKGDIEKVFNALIMTRIRYGISVYGCDAAALSKINKFLNRCFEKKLTSIKRSAEEILRLEDKRILDSILSNPMHPLLPFITSCPSQHNITRQQFTQLKPSTRTKLYSSIFCNRIRPF